MPRIARHVAAGRDQCAPGARGAARAGHSTLSVKQIAGVLGFDDEAYFGRFFKKHAGHTPTAFRGMARRQLAGEG
ncbi:helix-turn-helix domain-containing protein [Thauera sp. SDU_THAU2]|uniref:helix-turn-helix domain-containing protein n=1 Tax=Thauera sp. SDU_THAU2 TaxID=3136633 RepID=UPI0040552D6B